MSEKTELFGNFSEEAIAEGIEKLVDQKVKKLWGDSTTRTERFSNQARYAPHQWDGDIRSKDFSVSIDKAPFASVAHHPTKQISESQAHETLEQNLANAWVHMLKMLISYQIREDKDRRFSPEAKAQAVIDAWDGCGRYPDSSGDREHLDKAIEDLRESLNRE